MAKKNIRSLKLKDKSVLMRVDFNVPLKAGKVVDETRIEKALPTIEYVIQHGGKLILMSHLGRPKGKALPEFSLRPVALKLAEMLGQPVELADDCVGASVRKLVAGMTAGDVVLLENVRYHPEEELLNKYDAQDADTQAEIDAFAKQLAALGDIYVNDAFGTAHRRHVSTAGVAAYIDDCVSGFLMEKEVKYFGDTLATPERPLVAILGGAKVSDKVMVIDNLIDKVDTIIIGGAMAYTLLKADGKPVGTSLVEEGKILVAKDVFKKAKDKGVLLLLPIDHVCAREFNSEEPDGTFEDIPDDMMALDIGSKTIDLFTKAISEAKTVVWNGPMGVFEKSAYSRGTFTVARCVARTNCVSIIGGGDSVSAVNKSGLADKMTHISTGGGASLEFLEGKTLPGVAALNEKE